MSHNQQILPVARRSGLNWADIVAQQVKSIRYGVVEIVVQDSRVVQIEKTERLRLDKLDRPGES